MGFEMLLPYNTEASVIKEKIEIHTILADVFRIVGDKIAYEKQLVMIDSLKTSLLNLPNVA